MFVFTRQEQRFILFLVITFFLGLGVSYIKKRNFLIDEDKRLALQQSQIEQFRKISTQDSLAFGLSNTDESKEQIININNTAIKQKFVSKVNINTANAAELIGLPRIGPAMAERIIEYRKKNGPFQSIQDLQKVKGIGQKTFDAIENYISIN